MTSILDPPVFYYAAVGILCWVAYFIFPYLRDPHNLRRTSIGGPKLAALSNAWLAYVAARGDRSESVHRLHQKYGKFVRIAPNHVSIADHKALEVVYAHGSGTLKSDFYDAFVSIRPSLFTTRDRAAHARKRKVVSSVFSQQNVLQFEPVIRRHIRAFIAQWDLRCARAAAAGERGGRSWFNVPSHFNFLTFDITGDLAFGTSFNMIAAQKDVAPMVQLGVAGEKAEVEYIPAIKVLNDRGNFSASLGVLPPWVREWVRCIPWYASGSKAVESLAGMANAAVERRLKDGVTEDDMDEDEEGEKRERTDLLEKLMQGKDEQGEPLGREELTAEALTLMIAGTDTTSNSSCAITYHLAANPETQRKLQVELDSVLLSVRSAPPAISESNPAPLPPSSVAVKHVDIKSLPYLQACVNEGLRLHTPLGAGLPRIVPAGTTLEVCGEAFVGGTILSVPVYSVHQDQESWGEDSGQFKPERWLGRTVGREFSPFSFGPRACVGRNLANLIILETIASIFHRYEFELEQPDQKPVIREGLLRKPMQCVLGMRRRETSLG
ncbi:cytochrome P450 monooxygenase pc-bph [Ceratobasidium sp. AG-I]|nr:cytochrome P450 monooxygenase pc-bph [Ceratobasidium sp. AG-I]